MTTWVTRFDPPRPRHGTTGGGSARHDTARPGTGARPLRVAVKDAIDVAGTVTTAGCSAVRDRGVPATEDAACLSGVRAAGAIIVGKTTLTELCLSPTGVNPTFGTPVNPLAPDRIPGGSSSGSAVAVADGEADIGLGTDTGGSVRIPAACCGIVGLKTTWGRVPAAGVWPLAPSLDSVGTLARDIPGVMAGMRLLDPGWTTDRPPARTVGRLRIDGVDPAIEHAIDTALDAAGLFVRTVRLAGWDATYHALDVIILGELWRAHHTLLDAPGVGTFVNEALHAGRAVPADRLAGARGAQAGWRAEVGAALGEVDVLALPTLIGMPPPLDGYLAFPLTKLTAPVNLAGVPAIALPVPAPGLPVPASLQLVGPMYGEGLVCATAQVIETAITAQKG